MGVPTLATAGCTRRLGEDQLRGEEGGLHADSGAILRRVGRNRPDHDLERGPSHGIAAGPDRHDNGALRQAGGDHSGALPRARLRRRSGRGLLLAQEFAPLAVGDAA